MSEKHSKNEQPFHAAVYLRMSTDEQENSIERQRSQVLPYCQRRGYEIVGEYKDEATRGYVDRRPDFQRLLKDAKAGDFSVIVVDEPSRLSRQDPIEFIETVVAPLRRAGVSFDSVASGPLDWNSLPGILVGVIHQDKSAGESKTLSRRTLTGILNKTLEGQRVNGFPPYGYRIATVDGRRIYILGDPHEVEVVRWMFRQVAERGWTVGQVHAELNARCATPPRGNGKQTKTKQLGRWNRATVRNVLRNRVYVGDLAWNRVRRGRFSEYKDEQVTVASMRLNGCRASAPEDWIIVENTHPAIVDRDTFQRVQEVLAENRKRTSPKTKTLGRYLLSRMVVCGRCGAFMTGKGDSARKGEQGHKAYFCTSALRLGKHVCPNKRIREDRLLDSVIRALQEQYLAPEKFAELEAEMKRQEEAARAPGGEADRLRGRLDELNAAIDQGHANLAILPGDVLPGVIAKVRAFEGERGQVAAQLEKLESGDRQRDIEEVLKIAKAELWRLREGLQADDPDLVTAVLREYVDRIEVHFVEEKRGSKSVQAFDHGIIYLRPEATSSHLACSDP